MSADSEEELFPAGDYPLSCVYKSTPNGVVIALAEPTAHYFFHKSANDNATALNRKPPTEAQKVSEIPHTSRPPNTMGHNDGIEHDLDYSVESEEDLGPNHPHADVGASLNRNPSTQAQRVSELLRRPRLTQSPPPDTACPLTDLFSPCS